MDKREQVKKMFGGIAEKYDRLNRIMTLGMDLRWRRYLISKSMIPEQGRVLDAGTGTGDLAIGIKDRHSGVSVTGLDMTAEMMNEGRKRRGAGSVSWCIGDALNLPFPDGTFNSVVSGFLARNVSDLSMLFREQVRVVKHGGAVLCLDTTPPPDNMLRPFALFYLRRIIPLLGYLVAGKMDAYTYLPSSTINFTKPEKLAEIMRDAGLKNVQYKSFMFGNISVHRGIRP